MLTLIVREGACSGSCKYILDRLLSVISTAPLLPFHIQTLLPFLCGDAVLFLLRLLLLIGALVLARFMQFLHNIVA